MNFARHIPFRAPLKVAGRAVCQSGDVGGLLKIAMNKKSLTRAEAVTVIALIPFTWAVLCFSTFFVASAVGLGWKAALALLN